LSGQEFLARGGRFCLSDDSHGLDQIGLNYARMLEFIETKTDIKTLYYLDLGSEPETQTPVDSRYPRTVVKSVSVEEVKKMAFWQAS
jgi:histidinol-phosphatase (PHP family)